MKYFKLKRYIYIYIYIYIYRERERERERKLLACYPPTPFFLRLEMIDI